MTGSKIVTTETAEDGDVAFHDRELHALAGSAPRPGGQTLNLFTRSAHGGKRRPGIPATYFAQGLGLGVALDEGGSKGMTNVG